MLEKDTIPCSPTSLDAAQFLAAQMDLIAGFRMGAAAEAVERMYADAARVRAACITFDDGYLNNLTVAARRSCAPANAGDAVRVDGLHRQRI